jgi:nickel/cobalt exporter
MMNGETLALLGTAVVVGGVHTAAGPDHYLPFVALARARNWTLRRTLGVTAACAAGHIASAALIGVAALAFGFGLDRLRILEAHRGGMAAWLLIGLGGAYATWGWVSAARGRRHAHLHTHADGTVHVHEHAHGGEHLHLHEGRGGKSLPWVLFLVFVFGPCEPLIPLVVVPAATLGPIVTVEVSLLFGAATLVTMLTLVTLGYQGVARLTAPAVLSRYGHVAAGLLILACGVAVKLGL